MAPDGRLVGEDASEPDVQVGRHSIPQRFLLLSFGAGGVGLVAWCILDYILVRFAPTHIHDFDGVFLYFPVAVLLAGLFVFRGIGLVARVTWSTAAALASSVVAVLLMLFFGIQFHLAIGGSL